MAELASRTRPVPSRASRIHTSVRCTRWATEIGVDFLVMEYLEGETLAARLRKGRMPLAQALRTAVGGIAGALAAAHAQGIVHRDLKPSNVMLTAGGAKLLDFSLAPARAPTESALSPGSGALPSTQTDPGLIAGTLLYMAPEQLEGNEVDARADIFAFGVVLYEMIAGRKAFEGTSQARVMSRDPVVPPSGDRGAPTTDTTCSRSGD